MDFLIPLLFLVIFIWVTYRLFKWVITFIGGLFSSRKSEPELHFTVSVSYTDDEDERPKRHKGKPARWFGPGESVSVEGYKLPGGMVYVGGHFPETGQGARLSSCLIVPGLTVTACEPDIPKDEMGYWPSYYSISSVARGAYLRWLATGRRDPNANIGLVFLFFYGIERRLLSGLDETPPEPAERAAMEAEVRRLLGLYGQNRSFYHYATTLLGAHWLSHQTGNEPLSDLNEQLAENELVVRYLVAKHSKQEKPVPADLALAWLQHHPERHLKTPARRCPSEFSELFQHLYKKHHGVGMVVKPNKRALEIVYRFASAGYEQRAIMPIEGGLPDPFELAGPLRKLQAIADQAVEQLEPYSRYMGKKGSDPGSMDAKALLPSVLMQQDEGMTAIQERLDAYMAGTSGYGLLGVKELYRLLGRSAPAKIMKKEAVTVAEMIEKFGYGIAPDMRYHKPRLDPLGSVVLFPKGHGVDFQPSVEFDMMGAILRLGALIAQIDDVKPVEEEMLHNVVRDDRELTGIEKDSLAALLHWMLYTPQSTAGIKQKLAVLSQIERETISHILITVAHADGYIDPDEVKQLEKLYNTLGLDKGLVTSDLHVYAAQHANRGEVAPVTVETGTPQVTHAISSGPKPAPATTIGFQINEELLKLREQETQQVKGVLADIFTEEDGSAAPPLTEEELEDGASVLAGLDAAHRSLFNTLITKETWDRQAFHGLCEPMKLFVDGAMETLNEWAYDQVNAPLIEDGDPIFIDIELAKEIIEA